MSPEVVVVAAPTEVLAFEETVTPVAPVIWVTVAPGPPAATVAAPLVAVTSLAVI